jgi:Protein of unknown function (DUF2795)
VAVNPIRSQAFLGGVDHPTDKGTLVVERAHSDCADDDVLRTLRELPMERSNSSNGVDEALGRH